MIQIIRLTCFSLICLGFIGGCQSQPAKQAALKPAPLAVFKHETVWIQTSALNPANNFAIQNFNTKLKSRLKMYGAQQIKTDETSHSQADGIVIISKIDLANTESTYELSILRKDRELISQTYSQSSEGDQIAINNFLMSIHQIIERADTYF